MAGGVNRKISAASARGHTRKAKQNSSFKLPSGGFFVLFIYLFDLGAVNLSCALFIFIVFVYVGTITLSYQGRSFCLTFVIAKK